MKQPLGFVAWGSLLNWYAIFTNLYMVSSNILGFGLKNLVLFNSLIWLAMRQII